MDRSEALRAIQWVSDPIKQAHVALLRGVNVGGANRRLRILFIEAGGSDVETLIQSGARIGSSKM